MSEALVRRRERVAGSKSEIADAPLQLKVNADRPDLLGFARRLLAHELALVPGRATRRDGDELFHDGLLFRVKGALLCTVRELGRLRPPDRSSSCRSAHASSAADDVPQPRFPQLLPPRVTRGREPAYACRVYAQRV
jgi:hypothetical protein